MGEISVIPRRLFLTSLPAGEHELSCFVAFDGEPGTITWRCAPTDGHSADQLGSSRALSAAERVSNKVLIEAIVPAAWATVQLDVSVGSGANARRASWTVQTWTQRGTFRSPFAGPVLVIGAHRIGEPHRSAWRVPSQQFAWDLLPLGTEGWRVFNGAAEDLGAASFAAFGIPVLAPAPGRVVLSADGVPDQQAVGELPPQQTFRTDPIRAMGNYVVIGHGEGVWSFLGHLQCGSVRVRDGDEVRSGSVIGSVGASGNASGPHLHLHFMDAADPLIASPLPVELEVDGDRRCPQAGDLLSG